MSAAKARPEERTPARSSRPAVTTRVVPSFATSFRAEPLEQEAAEQRAEADADRRHRRPDPDRLAALLAREHVRDDRQRRRHDQRAADAHHRADGDQLVRALDDEHAQAAAAEQREAGLERVLAAEAVAERAHRQEQVGEDEHVGVDDPPQRRRRGVEVLLQARQRHVQDGVVEPE
jgi:hypothetical protein